MQAAWYERNGPAREVLVVGTLPDPEPGPGEVRVRIAASGVNPSDWKTRSGSRPMAGPRVIPHSDGAGTIDRVGPSVPQDRIGQRVWVWNAQWKRALGTAAQYVALPADQAVPLPSGTSFDEGACLGIPALTAWRAVTIDGGMAGRTVLVTGGAGAVGHYAIQFARLLGARRVLATVSSAAKAEHARGAGADAVIDYRTEPVAERVREETGGAGVDRVVEVDGAGSAALLPQLLARDGLAVVYGSNRPEITYAFGPMILAGAAVRFFIVYELPPEVRRAGIAQLTDWLDRGWVRHTVAARFPLAEIVAAHEALERGAVMGNLVLTVG
jgi:NADPH:quinone reductase